MLSMRIHFQCRSLSVACFNTVAYSMKMMYIVALALSVGCFTQLAVSEQVCSSFCSSIGILKSNPGKFCADIYQINKATRGVSRGYWVNTTNGIRQVYCDMELECGGYKGGWMRIADYNTRRGDNCPSGWVKMTANGIAVCRPPNNNRGCHSTTFSVQKVGFNKICGKIKGYQKGSPDAFYSSPSLNNGYVDGISITVGNPRNHIWTYAVGISDDHNYNGINACPCARYPGRAPPSFVGEHYYCESGNTGRHDNNQYHTEDPLWDGAGCSANNNCCSNADQPWFFRQLATNRQDDIEARLCNSLGFPDEATLVEQIQLYVQ